MSEHLLVYKAFKPKQWFDRRYDPETGKDVYEFGPSLKGQKYVWENATRPNALFLSMAIQLNSEQLRPVFDWFLNKLIIINERAFLDPRLSVEMLGKQQGKQNICHFLASADISIADIDLETRKQAVRAVQLDLAGGETQVRNEEQDVHEFGLLIKIRIKLLSYIPYQTFSPRKNEGLEHGYLIGRYGALPFVDEEVVQKQ